MKKGKKIRNIHVKCNEWKKNNNMSSYSLGDSFSVSIMTTLSCSHCDRLFVFEESKFVVWSKVRECANERGWVCCRFDQLQWQTSRYWQFAKEVFEWARLQRALDGHPGRGRWASRHHTCTWHLRPYSTYDYVVGRVDVRWTVDSHLDSEFRAITDCMQP